MAADNNYIPNLFIFQYYLILTSTILQNVKLFWTKFKQLPYLQDKGWNKILNIINYKVGIVSSNFFNLFCDLGTVIIKHN
jgi:hypothetical protein